MNANLSKGSTPARHRKRKGPKLKGLLVCTALTGAAIFSTMWGADAADTFPSQDACATTNNNTPVGDCGPFVQLYKENFNGADVAVGKFNTCAGDGDFRCEGLAGTRYYDTLGAYPRGWYDTANPKNHSNGNTRTLGGEYRSDDTTSVLTTSTGDGQMRVHMYRPAAGGDVHVSAPVPRRCMGLRYGKFTERLIVRTRTDGYKMAHLRYSPNEIDYPEAGGNFSTDPVSWFTHGFSEDGSDVAPNTSWTSWHTFSTEITPSNVKFYLDGKLMNTVNAQFPDNTDWVLQNESSLDGGYAAKGSSVNIDTTFVTCYKYDPALAKKRAGK